MASLGHNDLSPLLSQNTIVTTLQYSFDTYPSRCLDIAHNRLEMKSNIFPDMKLKADMFPVWLIMIFRWMGLNNLKNQS